MILPGIILILFSMLPVQGSTPIEAVDVCQLLERPAKFADKSVAVRGAIKRLMHGTYLESQRCESSLFIALPTEIPKLKRPVSVQKDAALEAFLQARFDPRPDAPSFTATFVGILEYAPHGKGYGYLGKNKTRLIVCRVADVDQTQSAKNDGSKESGSMATTDRDHVMTKQTPCT